MKKRKKKRDSKTLISMDNTKEIRFPSSGMICRRRTQDLQDGFGDVYCKACWDETEYPGRSFLFRSGCYSENAVHHSVFSN